jgi:hypothetical protein
MLASHKRPTSTSSAPEPRRASKQSREERAEEEERREIEKGVEQQAA